MQKDFEPLFEKLKRSPFRSRFTLRGKGMDTIVEHACGFIGERLAPADPPLLRG